VFDQAKLSGGRRRLGFLLLLALGLPSVVFADNPVQIDRLAGQWLAIERQANHLKSDWKIQQPVLSQRVTLLKAERRQLQALLKTSSVSGDDVDTRRAQLLKEQAELEQQQAQLSRSLIQLSGALAGVAPLLPPALARVWQDEQRALSEGAETSEQLQVALAQLAHLADFDWRVSVHEGMVSAADGQTILVKQLYLGAGLAWFTSRDEQQAGWGQAGDSGWYWHFDDNVSAAEVAKAIAIFEKRETAELVRLPIRIAAQRNGLKTAAITASERSRSGGEKQP